jgi:hypothetical protein
MAFSADELRVVRRALAEVLEPRRPAAADCAVVPRQTEYVKDYLRLVEAVDEAVFEAGRLRAFLLDELDRYRQALPGSAGGYLDRLAGAVAGGYVPGPEDLAALRRLRALPCGTPEYARRDALTRRCETLAENDVRLRLEAHMPEPRRLLTLLRPESAEPSPRPARKPDQKPGQAPEPATKPVAPPVEPAEEPGRRTPTPAEIWPPHRRPRKPEALSA